MKYISKSLIINLPLLSIKDLTMKCNEEEKSLSSEAFSRVSLTNLRRSAVPDLSSDLGMNIFKKVSRTIYVLCILVIKKKIHSGAWDASDHAAELGGMEKDFRTEVHSQL